MLKEAQEKQRIEIADSQLSKEEQKLRKLEKKKYDEQEKKDKKKNGILNTQ